jgi:hypothetical protein
MLLDNFVANTVPALLSSSVDVTFVDQSKVDLALELVNSLDFGLQIKKMTEYNGLDKNYVYSCLHQYKDFLAMKIAYKDREIDFVPNSMIDEAWHQHILDTKKYASDCNILFGEFLHHYPYSGLRGDDDVKVWQDNAHTTEVIFYHHFDKRIYSKNNMGRGCSSQGCW